VSERTGRAPLHFFDKVYWLVQQIPAGKVASYGQIAEMLSAPGAARTVGWALASLTEAQAVVVPWQRVINKAGRCSIRSFEHAAAEQQALLEAEGVEFNEHGYVNWKRFGWVGMDPFEVDALLTTRAQLV
jgi:methylated-DNA-protein-cysteine methyltransferase-like protein